MSAPSAPATQRPGGSGTESSHSLDPGAAARWAAWRRPLAVVSVVLVVSLLLGWVASGERRGYLDPEGVDQTGSRALVRVLAAEGVDVIPARTTAEAADAAGDGRAPVPVTLLVTVPGLLDDEQVSRLTATGADVVLVSPGPEVAAWVPGIRPVGTASPSTVEPGCDLAEARRAGSARIGRVLYAGDDEAAAACYQVDGQPSLVVTEVDDRRVTVLGNADVLTNRYLDEAGNASLATGLLGRGTRLVWYRPVPERSATDGVPVTALLPGWTGPVAAQLLVAAAVAALWRGRRLGPVVTEPLPVTVRSAEAVEGRARLYRRGRARGHAALALRQASTERLRQSLAMPRGSGVTAVAAAAASRTGRDERAVATLLGGTPPADDRSLVRLADDLDSLEQEVLHQ